MSLTSAMVMLSLIALAAITQPAYAESNHLGTNSVMVASGVDYLVRNYDATVGLIHESPDSKNLSDTYWLFSDNFLAGIVLQRAGADNVSLSLMATNISRTSALYLYGKPNPVNQYLVLTTSLFPFNASKNFTFHKGGGAVVKSTVNNQTGTLEPTKYADIAFLQAIGYHNRGEDSSANQVFNYGTALWNGTGFKDAAFATTFATYKIALYVYAARLLGQPVNPSISQSLLSLQLHSGDDSGGFATSYTGNFKPASGSNTETTSLAILALSVPASNGGLSDILESPVLDLVLVVLLLGAGLGMPVLIWRHRRTQRKG
ncbi:MAG: hypothetical protein HY296_07635 [Thaumarchaeota archaeon]|nr:hypothetical protein [Nitrososphaerota archaeon]